jgi:hypothetical protein
MLHSSYCCTYIIMYTSLSLCTYTLLITKRASSGPVIPVRPLLLSLAHAFTFHFCCGFFTKLMRSLSHTHTVVKLHVCLTTSCILQKLTMALFSRLISRFFLVFSAETVFFSHKNSWNSVSTCFFSESNGPIYLDQCKKC